MYAVAKRCTTVWLLIQAILLASCATAPVQPDPVSHETAVRHARPHLDQEVFDSQESDQALAVCFAQADAIAERKVANVPRYDGFIQTFWKVKTRILKRQCGIDWRSPAELNPGIDYDNYGQPKLTSAELSAANSVVTANLITPDELIGYSWRAFTGEVIVVTRSESTQEVRHYELRGHDSVWELVSVGVIEE